MSSRSGTQSQQLSCPMNRPWSEAEVEALVHLVEQDTPLASICAILRREGSDVLDAIRRLEIRYYGSALPPSANEQEEK